MKTTGYYGHIDHTGRVRSGKVHAVETGRPICGATPDLTTFQWCGGDWVLHYINCDRCKKKLDEYNAKKLLQELSKTSNSGNRQQNSSEQQKQSASRRVRDLATRRKCNGGPGVCGGAHHDHNQKGISSAEQNTKHPHKSPALRQTHRMRHTKQNQPVVSYFYYVIVGDGGMAQVAHSPLNYFQMQERIRSLVQLDSKQKPYFQVGVLRFYNPKVMMAPDFITTLPIMVES